MQMDLNQTQRKYCIHATKNGDEYGVKGKPIQINQYRCKYDN